MTKQKEEAIYRVFGLDDEVETQQEPCKVYTPLINSKGEVYLKAVHKEIEADPDKIYEAAPSMLIMLWEIIELIDCSKWTEMDVIGNVVDPKRLIAEIHNSCTSKAWTFEQIAEAVDKECEG